MIYEIYLQIAGAEPARGSVRRRPVARPRPQSSAASRTKNVCSIAIIGRPWGRRPRAARMVGTRFGCSQVDDRDHSRPPPRRAIHLRAMTLVAPRRARRRRNSRRSGSAPATTVALLFAQRTCRSSKRASVGRRASAPMPCRSNWACPPRRPRWTISCATSNARPCWVGHGRTCLQEIAGCRPARKSGFSPSRRREVFCAAAVSHGPRISCRLPAWDDGLGANG